MANAVCCLFAERAQNPLWNFAADKEGIDKTLKLTSAIFEAADPANSINHSIKDTRVVIGLFNVLAGTPYVIRKEASGLTEAVKSLLNGRVFIFKGREYHAAYEKILFIVKYLGNLIGALTYTVGFGVCAPIRFADAHTKGGVGESARSIGNQFSFVMMINQFGVIASNIADFIRINLDTPNTLEEVAHYWREMVTILISFFEKVGEIIVSSIKVLGARAPQLVVLVLNIVSAFLALIRVWRTVNA